MLLEQRAQEGDEGAAAAHHHLEQQRLAFLDCHAAVLTDGLVHPPGRQPEVVKRLARLVQRAEQTLERVLQHEARRDTDVAWNAFGERMVALVEAATVERESERLHDVDAEVPLAAH
jgi:hypothetical protein